VQSEQVVAPNCADWTNSGRKLKDPATKKLLHAGVAGSPHPATDPTRDSNRVTSAAELQARSSPSLFSGKGPGRYGQPTRIKGLLLLLEFDHRRTLVDAVGLEEPVEYAQRADMSKPTTDDVFLLGEFRLGVATARLKGRA
jgi:hypothetical protein